MTPGKLAGELAGRSASSSASGRFFAPLAGPGGLGLLDDAALIECDAGRRLVVTADALVAGVHYLPDDPPERVAQKLAAGQSCPISRDGGKAALLPC